MTATSTAVSLGGVARVPRWAWVLAVLLCVAASLWALVMGFVVGVFWTGSGAGVLVCWASVLVVVVAFVVFRRRPRKLAVALGSCAVAIVIAVPPTWYDEGHEAVFAAVWNGPAVLYAGAGLVLWFSPSAGGHRMLTWALMAITVTVGVALAAGLAVAGRWVGERGSDTGPPTYSDVELELYERLVSPQSVSPFTEVLCHPAGSRPDDFDSLVSIRDGGRIVCDVRPETPSSRNGKWQYRVVCDGNECRSARIAGSGTQMPQSGSFSQDDLSDACRGC